MSLAMSDKTVWEDYCEASLDLSNQDDVGDLFLQTVRLSAALLNPCLVNTNSKPRIQHHYHA